MAGEKKYFLGIGGQQSGPFAESEVNDKIASGEAKSDTLVWYDGLGEWQRLDAIAFFQPTFKKTKSPSASVSMANASANTPQASASDVDLKPVFSSQEAVFYKRRAPSKLVIGGGAALLFFGGVGIWYMESEVDDDVVIRQAARQRDSTSRPARLKKADSDYLLNPGVVPDDLGKLIVENAKDDVGVAAVASLEAILKKKRRLHELADLYMRVGRSADAVPVYIEEKSYAEAVKAADQAYGTVIDHALKRKLLVTNIELLTSQMQNLPAALPKIALLEKDFPNEPNPFSYYLLSEEKKMADLFNRTSYFFVENLINHMKAEFPEIRLIERPVVSIVREPGNKYRIAGSYKGEVQLSLDRLRNIRFEYWLVGNEWNLVSTNVTTARGAWAKGQRTKHASQTLTGQSLLAYLEGVMHAQFPRLGLHEKVSREQLASAARETAVAK
jgi:hypothetical protein